MIRRLLVAALAALALVASAAPLATAAAKRPTLSAPVVFTVDLRSPEITAAQEAAAAWSKNTGVQLVFGDCSGPRCLHLEHVALADSYCADIPNAAGCREYLADGSQAIQLMDPTFFDGYHYSYQLSVVEHEFGHGIGLPHKGVDVDPNSVMNPGIEATQRAQAYNTVDAGDRKDAQALYP